MSASAAPIGEALQVRYAAATARCLIVEHPTPGILTARGHSVLEFLHRMSTNDLVGLTPGKIRGTVLTTAIGRIVDVVQVLPRTSDFLLLTSPGKANDVRSWLARHIFFNDDVLLAQAESPHALWGLYGPSAPTALEELAGREMKVLGSDVGEFDGGLVWRNDSGLDGLVVLVDDGGQARAETLWGPGGRDPYAQAAYQALRIERGIPEAGREITSDVIPLEIGLWDYVSFTKGCYIGQEVIARMESRGQVARRLVGVRLDEIVDTPQTIENQGRDVGSLTSVAQSPRFGPIGLALVRTATSDDSGEGLQLAPSGASIRLTSLPIAS